MERPIAGVRMSRFNIAPLAHILLEQRVQSISGAQLITTTPKQKTSPRICDCRQRADLGTSTKSGVWGNLDRSALSWALIRNCSGNGRTSCGPAGCGGHRAANRSTTWLRRRVDFRLSRLEIRTRDFQDVLQYEPLICKCSCSFCSSQEIVKHRNSKHAI